MRRIVCPVLALLCSCGGGGGGGGGGGTNPASPEQQLALQILKDCGNATVQLQLDAVLALRDVLDPGLAGAPRFEFTDLSGTLVTWSLDIDDNGTDDYAGSLRFLDAGGAAFAPFDLSLLLGTQSRLLVFFSQVPDQTTLAINYSSTAGNSVGQFNAIITGNIVVTVAGNGTTGPTACLGIFNYADVPFADLLGFFPRLTFQVQITSAPDFVTGTALLDGSPAVSFSVRLNIFAEIFAFLMNLQTGEVF